MRVFRASIALLVFVACVGDNPDTNPTASSTSSSSGASGGVGTVQCNDKECSAGDVCCLVFGDASVQSAECKPEAACSTGALVCDGKSDCADGEICCVKTRGGSVQYGPSYCSKTCDASNRDAQLCRESSECTSGSCVTPQSSTTPTNLKECK